ncbi:hypothetical protein P9112_000623 [Eukaryota sp. TZLM1-RC]
MHPFVLLICLLGLTSANPGSPPSNRYFDIYPFLGFHEPVSSITHFITAILIATFSYKLFARCKDKQAVVGCALYVFGACFSMSMSGVYHMLRPYTTSRAVLRRLDHAAIFTMISGTFTALHVVSFKTFLYRWLLVIFVGTVSVTSITLKTIFFKHLGDSILMGALYVAIGWIAVISVIMLWKTHHDRKPIIYLFVGGISYTVGAIIEGFFQSVLTIIPGVIHAHEVFHFFIMAGAYYHFKAILYCLNNFHAQNAKEKQYEAQGSELGEFV